MPTPIAPLRWIVSGLLLCGSSAQAFVDLARAPDSIEVIAEEGTAKAARSEIAEVTFDAQPSKLAVKLHAPKAGIRQLKLHWNGKVDPASKCLGDVWERAYIDLGWKPLADSGTMPWYVMVNDGTRTDGYGIMTAPAALCYWEVTADGITLTADVCSGGVGVELGNRTLDVCTVVCRPGAEKEDSFDAGVAFCKQMCPNPRLPKQPVYGYNDWNSTYGHNTADHFLKDATTLAALAPAGDNRPYMVVDDGWQGNRQDDPPTSDPWSRTNKKFGSSIPELCKQVKGLNAHFGLWYRPLEAPPGTPNHEKLHGNSLDPSVPSVRRRIAQDVARFREWGVELIKFDFTTQEIFGRFGDHMKPLPGSGEWTFVDRTHTSAEIVLELYRTIREAAGDGMVIDGCNTLSHLSAGMFELYRIGDDTSGQEWHRQKYGVNALAFRGVQQGTFYQADPDMVALAKAGAIPWDQNRQWLELAAESGTTFIVSWKTELMDDTVKEAIRKGFEQASKPQPVARPVDGMETNFPTRWKLGEREATYKW
ncbi:MAG: alpha-galactosidase [Tepidisphaeraceae bacterium]